jgi:hypothetical protein
VPPSRIHVFHSYTLEEFQAQNLLPWRIPNSKPFIPEKFQALKNSNLKTLYPEEFHEEFQAQIPLPLKNSNLKTLYAAWKNSTLETLLPRRIPSSKPFSHDEFHAQNPLSLKNSRDPRQGVGCTDIKWNSPIIFIVARMKTFIYTVLFNTEINQYIDFLLN